MMSPSRLAAAVALLWALAAGCASPTSTTGPHSRSMTSAAPVVAGPVDELPELPADAREKVLAEMTSVLLSDKHLLRHPIDDALSKQSFPNFIEELDGAKLLLLQEHVRALSKYADRMDDEIRERNLVLARKGAALVAERRKVAAKIVEEILAKPFDFTLDEEAETDPEKLAFCQTEGELRDRWRRALKLQALERIQQMEEIATRNKEAKKDKPDASADQTDEDDEAPVRELDPLSIPASFEGREAKARKDIAIRYQTRFSRLASPDPLEPASLFLNAMASAIDPHTQYLAPADKANFDIAISGTLEGIGAVLGEQDHYIVVRELVPGGASWKQGRLEAGDLIIAVAQAGKAAVDVTDMPIDKVVQMIRGPKGSVVTLTVKKADGKVESIPITRDVIEVEATYARGAVLDFGPKHDKMGYVHLPGFYGDINGTGHSHERNATDDVRALLVEFEKKKLPGVVIDLRGNGGGLLSHARDISGLFVPRGPVVQTRDSGGKIGVLADTDPSVAFSGQVVVLVDRFSASAAEILAAALQDYERAVIVGTGTTHGKGTVQAVVELDNLLEAPAKEPLGVFKLTIEQYFRVTGGSVQWKGVTPDIVLPDPAAYVETGERTLPHSIPWTSVAPLPYTRSAHRWLVGELAAASRTRVKANNVFDKVDAFSKLLKARREDTRESLRRETWTAERKRDKEMLDAADPKLKQLSPLLEVQPVSSASTPPPPPDKRLRRKLDSWKDELARDPWVAESLQVLADMAKKK